eukprot:CAMPEP_0204606150 /NCGR_PEP_ID=MMETSP0661-20131031/58914_1 /ASSEMBLY_ACC=CAM_ASM_000606 /TAXON_ID=109239 /ORGANISM="Alexandrium margalefi, Strain AMGDE01CS-322" /LENGTH=211 /DNA_ID=CAMNT_0051617441 /DNA_START=94 /DNA_END=726 /DNA_ORIENTATION=+
MPSALVSLVCGHVKVFINDATLAKGFLACLPINPPTIGSTRVEHYRLDRDDEADASENDEKDQKDVKDDSDTSTDVSTKREEPDERDEKDLDASADGCAGPDTSTDISTVRSTDVEASDTIDNFNTKIQEMITALQNMPTINDLQRICDDVLKSTEMAQCSFPDSGIGVTQNGLSDIIDNVAPKTQDEDEEGIPPNKGNLAESGLKVDSGF